MNGMETGTLNDLPMRGTRMEGSASKAATKTMGGGEVRKWAAWLAILLTAAAILLLAALHVLSPEFSPSWRVISEYALGRYPWVLSLMFFCMGSSSWALAAAIWPEAQSIGGKFGKWLLLIAGLGGVMASYFDITRMIGHTVAGLLGVIGFPIAAMLLSVALGRTKDWRAARPRLFFVANLSWISVVLLVATLFIMTMQMSQLNGGHLPQHAPKVLPSGVIALDGWADRLIILTNSAWIVLAAWQVIRVRRGSVTAT